MYYQGNIEIVDRGDAPALEVIDKNARSLAQRAADETKDELKKVLTRVDDIYNSFELSNSLDSHSNLEYVDSIQDLEDILRDQIKKQKYKQQVTIFIVGFQDVCHQKLTLLQQVNEFFMANSKSFETEDWFPVTPDIDLEDVATKVEESLATAEELTSRLGELNKEMVTYLTNYALNKGNHKAKKKVEKSLQQAKDDINTLSEKLLAVQTELEEKEEKVVSLLKQVEAKHMEIQRYKTAAEVAKKNMKDNEGMKEELERRGHLIQEQQKRLESLELELAQTKNSKERSDERVTNHNQDSMTKIEDLQRLVNEKQLALEEAKRDLERLHEMQIISLRDAHQAEIEELQSNHAEEIRKLLGEIDDYKGQIENLEEGERAADVTTTTTASAAGPPAEARDDQSTSSKASSKDKKKRPRRSKSRSKSRESRSTKETNRSRSQSSIASKKSGAQSSKHSSKSSKWKPEESAGKVYAEVSVQDEGGNHEEAIVTSHSLKALRENTSDFDNHFDLDDEAAWSTVPAEHVNGRFKQFRELTQKRLAELRDQLAFTMSKTQSKVETLKSQFKEHKSKWEAERNVLVQQIEQAMKLQSEAENEADSAMNQLEEFIIEQEKLENIEDQKFLQLSRNTTRSAEDAQAELARQSVELDKNEVTSAETVPNMSERVAEVTTGEDVTPPFQITIHPEDEIVLTPAPIETELFEEEEVTDTDGQLDTVRPRSEGEPELTKLLLQTDDAKVQELRRSATTLSATPHVETPIGENEQHRCKSAQAAPMTQLLAATTNEEFRDLMSKSRADLRSQYKFRLDETKQAAEDRRSKSPAVSVPSLHSLDEDQLIEEEDEDLEEFLISYEESKSLTEEKGTSPPVSRKERKSFDAKSVTPIVRTPVAVRTIASQTDRTGESKELGIKGEHPVVMEYLKTYNGVSNFKDTVTKLLLDKDMMSLSQVLSDIEMFLFDKDADVKPQLETMSSTVSYVLDELSSLLATVLVNDRDVMVSSLGNVSREATQTQLLSRERSEDSGRGLTGTRVSTRSRSAISRHSNKSAPGETEAMIELKVTCARLQRQLQIDTKKHEEQMRHNTVLMMEMQNTITGLQRELSELGKLDSSQQIPAEPSIMFTRLDSERNAKIMKRALFEDRLDTEKYKEAVNQMDQYVSLPAQRLAQLVRKYVHHRQMKQIEENVRHSRSLNENVFAILDKMETLQNKRARQWTDKMDVLSGERNRLASLLMDTFDNIEHESGIFLIKPIYSFKGREIKERSVGKMSRCYKTREGSPTRETCRSAVAPAPTPATGTRPATRQSYGRLMQQTQSETSLFSRPQQTEPSSGVTGLGMVWPVGQPRAVWNLMSSQTKEYSDENLINYANHNNNTPRILELDINRMLIGQNNVSGRMRGALTDDRLLNASNNSVRSYVTVNRPTVPPGQGRVYDGVVPPSTPLRPSSVQDRSSVTSERRRRLPSSPPLPPITLTQGQSSIKIADARSHSDHSLGHNSPPGSSLRFTPPIHDLELQSELDIC